MNEISEILKAEMAREGTISFARFMEVALYCPNFGYYERTDVSPGRKGDFYTSVSVGALFGELLGNQFEGWARGIAGCGLSIADSGTSSPTASLNKPWQIVEAGAHDGRLALDILRWMKAERGESFAALEYWILEPSIQRRQVQEKTLAEFSGKVKWFGDWNELPASGVNGVIFSNELLDAMPVHRMGWDAKKKHWFEWGVAWDGNRFVWTRHTKFQNEKFRMEDHFGVLPGELLNVFPDEFTTEICPAAVEWWRRAAQALKAGKLVAFDYGLKAEYFFMPTRKEGTLRAYYEHHQTSDVLASPGEQDITAQVNFSAIQAAGEAEGLKTGSFTAQRVFLTTIIEKNCCDNPTVKDWTPSRVRQFQTLTHPEHLGQSFQVLVQARE